MKQLLVRLMPALILAVAAFTQQFSEVATQGGASTASAAPAPAEPAALDRLPATQFDVTPPPARVTGEPGTMRTRSQACRALPEAEVRRRIVDVATQEWGFFGFPIRDQQEGDLSDEEPQPMRLPGKNRGPRRGGNPEEGARVASTIAGYWAVTPEGPWIVEEQNDSWKSEFGTGARWNAAWSAAFISWVMCESGLGSSDQFKRAVAHVTYIDQAIRARDALNTKGSPKTAFIAYDRGETEIVPGDLLCAGSRPIFRSLAERRRQLGKGARSHCDIVVKVDEPQKQILTIGGNVGGRVSLKIRAAEVSKQGELAPTNEAIFAHLKLRAGVVEADALDHTPTMQSPTLTADSCAEAVPPNQLRAMTLLSESPAASCE